MENRDIKRPTQQENVRNKLRNRFVIFGRMAFPVIGIQPDCSRNGCYRRIKMIMLDFKKIASVVVSGLLWLIGLIRLIGLIG